MGKGDQYSVTRQYRLRRVKAQWTSFQHRTSGSFIRFQGTVAGGVTADFCPIKTDLSRPCYAAYTNTCLFHCSMLADCHLKVSSQLCI